MKLRDHTIETKNQKEFVEVRQVLRDLGEPIYELADREGAQTQDSLAFDEEDWCRHMNKPTTITAEDFIKRHSPNKDAVNYSGSHLLRDINSYIHEDDKLDERLIESLQTIYNEAKRVRKENKELKAKLEDIKSLLK